MPHTRHGEPFAAGSSTSYEAALKARAFVSEQGIKVLHWLQQRGEWGGTMKEAEHSLEIGRPSCCARFKALEDAGAIEKTSTKRAGCAVYRVVLRGTGPEQLAMW